MTSECQKLGVRHLNRINTEEKVWDGIWNIVPTHWEMLWVVGAQLKIILRKSKNITKDSDSVIDSSDSAGSGEQVQMQIWSLDVPQSVIMFFSNGYRL